MKKSDRLNLPNILTIARMVCIPAVVVLLLADSGGSISRQRSLVAFFLFVAAALTDLLDGFLARRYQMITDLGKLMDPLADKLLLCAAMIMLVPLSRVPAWMAVIVVAREIGVTALRGLAATEGLVIAASSLGKWKTALLNTGVAMLIMYYTTLGVPVKDIGFVVLTAGVVMTTWSGLDYFFRYVKELFKH